MRVAIYTRISLDPNNDSASPERQETLCRQLAEAREMTVVKVYTDRGASAWQRKAKRPGWEALRASVERSEVDVLMAYSLTRLGRRVRELLDLSDFLKANNCALIVYDMNLDTTSPGGQLVYTMIAAMAQMESEQISARVKSATYLNARKGKMHTGGRRSFGYDRDSQIIEIEAAVVRSIVDDLIAGKSLRQVAIGLNTNGVRSTAGKEWTSATVRQMVLSPLIAGLRTHTPTTDKKTTAKTMTYKGDWEPIIPEAEWLQMRAELDSRPNKRGGGVSTPRHLLSGIAVCGLCGTKLVAHFSTPEGRSRMDRYTCAKRPGSGACGKLAASKSSVDKFVINEFFDFMAGARLKPTADAASVERSLADIQAEIAVTEASIARLARDHYVTGRLPEDVFASTHDELSATLEALQRAESAATDELSLRTAVLVPGNRGDIEKWWSEASLPEQREALKRAIRRVVIAPAKVRGGNVFDTSRVKVEWSYLIYAEAAEEWEKIATPADVKAGKAEQDHQARADGLPGATYDEDGNTYDITIEPRAK